MSSSVMSLGGSMKINWRQIFAEAHLHSWPTASLSIQNVNPSPSQGSRNIFEDDKKEIERAAFEFGYKRLPGTKIISFINPTLHGEAKGIRRNRWVTHNYPSE
jgi:hypothetical protein